MNIVIVGSGFGGIKAAIELSKRHVGRITLISDEEYFLHHATLYATATGKSMAESVVPLKHVFANYPNVKVVHDKIISIDPSLRLLIGGKKQYHYDKVVLSLGSVTTYFGIKGMAEHCFGIKSLEDIKKFQNHIHEAVVEDKLDKEYVIVGAGPTGVELAGALCQYLHSIVKLHHLKHSKARVTLVEAAPRILPRMSPTSSKVVSKRLKSMGIRVMVNHKVEALDDDYILVDGKKIDTTTAVWTSGVANSPFFRDNADLFDLAPNGRVNVNQHLEALPDVYVIGDNNTVKYSGTAWSAMGQATFVAKHLSRLATKRPTQAFRPRSYASGVPVGDGWGYVEWMGIYAAGKIGAALRRHMELAGYRQLMPRKMAKELWRAHNIPEIDA